MNPTLIPILGDILGKVLGKVIDQIPVSQAEKDNAQLEASKAIADHADVIAQAEAQIVSATKDEWVTDVINGNALTKAWRPIVAYVGALIMLWDGILAPLVSLVVSKPLAGPSEIVLNTVCYVLLALVGVRSLEKIQLVRAKK